MGKPYNQTIQEVSEIGTNDAPGEFCQEISMVE